MASLGVLVPEADHEEDVPPQTGLGRSRHGSWGVDQARDQRMRRAGPLSDGAALVALLRVLVPGVTDPATAAKMGIATNLDVRRGRH